jgi:hypothetical protein
MKLTKTEKQLTRYVFMAWITKYSTALLVVAALAMGYQHLTDLADAQLKQFSSNV